MSLIDELKKVLGNKHVLTGTDKKRYSSDWLGQYTLGVRSIKCHGEPRKISFPCSDRHRKRKSSRAPVKSCNRLTVMLATSEKGELWQDELLYLAMELSQLLSSKCQSRSIVVKKYPTML